MDIKTEQDMNEVCRKAGKKVSIVLCAAKKDYAREFEEVNRAMMQAGKINKGSHLQQGIQDIRVRGRQVRITERPYIYPSQRILTENPELTGPTTGVLVNCYDPRNKRFLFQMRGPEISAAFKLQAAAAGMGIYGQHPAITASLELYQEAGLETSRQIIELDAIEILPFMKSGKIPQLLFSFGFLDDLSNFPVCRNLEEVAEFEESIQRRLKTGSIRQKEAYPLAIPGDIVERLIGELQEGPRFYGPIYESTLNFFRLLKDKGYLD